MTLYLGAGMTKRTLRGLSTSDAAKREGLLTGRGSPFGLLLPLGVSGRESGFGESARGASQLRSPVVNPVGDTIRILIEIFQRPGSLPTASCARIRHEPDHLPLLFDSSHQARHERCGLYQKTRPKSYLQVCSPTICLRRNWICMTGSGAVVVNSILDTCRPCCSSRLACEILGSHLTVLCGSSQGDSASTITA